MRHSLPLLVLAACASGPASIERPADQSVVRALPAGTVVRVLSVRGDVLPAVRTAAIDGWLREALRQSDWLDIAAGPVAAESGLAIAVTVDGVRGTLAASLVDGKVEQPLGTVTYAAARPERVLPSAIDRLALRLRIALGDPVSEQPRPVALIHTGDAEAAAGVELALQDAGMGDFAGASKRLQTIRKRDGASSFVLEAMASNASMLGAADEARRLAEEALQWTERRSPTTTHRLLRTLLLSRASLEPQLAGKYDQELWTLAQVAMRERPHDPEVRFTAGVALNFLGRFDEALPRLQELEQRLGAHTGTLYHLGWAALGAGDAATARDAFDRAARSLPIRATVVPRALARFAAGDREDLRLFLATVAQDPQVRSGAALHEIRRMQAANELLAGDGARAAEHILADVAWLQANPSVLELRAGELADMALVLVRLGEGERLRPLLDPIAAQWPDTIVADAATYAAGLVEATATKARATTIEAALERRGRPFWSSSLAAFGLRQQGERAAEGEALARASQHAANPLLKAMLIENLAATGRSDQARALRDALHRELAVVDLRRRSQSPLLAPEYAMAWLAGADDASVSH